MLNTFSGETIERLKWLQTWGNDQSYYRCHVTDATLKNAIAIIELTPDQVSQPEVDRLENGAISLDWTRNENWRVAAWINESYLQWEYALMPWEDSDSAEFEGKIPQSLRNALLLWEAGLYEQPATPDDQDD